jgi:outer membrane protein insertion porin family/translocation and assembly module TamA
MIDADVLCVNRAIASFACVMLAACLGCAKLPPGQTAVDDVEVRGTKRMSSGDVEDKLATTPSEKFLGLFRGIVYDYQVYNHATLQRDLARVERWYKARGYYSAVARAGRVIETGNRHVRVEVLVEEGEPTLTEDIVIVGIDGLPHPVQDAAIRAARLALPRGQPFDEDEFQHCESDVKSALTDRGYAFAKVTRDAYVDIVHRVANVEIDVEPGEPARFGPITFEGLDPDGDGPRKAELPESMLRRTMLIKEGQPYSTLDTTDAKLALLDLGVLASVTIEPDLSHPETHIVPLRVKVEPAKRHEVKLGVGLELDALKAEVRLIGGWEDHNFLGGLRHFSVEFIPGLVLYPTRINNLVAPDHFFFEERLRVQLRQPAFIEARTEGLVRVEANIYPLLVQTNPAPDDPVVGYREGKAVLGINRSFFSRKLYGSLTYNAQYEDPFAYKGPLDPALTPLLLSYPDLFVKLDFSDDKNHPHKGFYVANDLQVAGGPFFGDARDIKVQPEVRGYVPIAKRVTFASRATVGFLFASNYGNVVQNELADPITPDNRSERVHDIQTVLFRGLFSGGPSSNRGFVIRGVSPHGVVPFLNPFTASQQVAHGCNPASAANGFTAPDPNQCSTPIGGFTLWEFSNEFRFRFNGPFSAATFCDMSDVSPQEMDIRLGHLHLSCGVGARYDTPAGPIRLDVGYRIQPLQVLGYKSEQAAFNADPTNGLQPTFFGSGLGGGIPVAISIGIGEAY